MNYTSPAAQRPRCYVIIIRAWSFFLFAAMFGRGLWTICGTPSINYFMRGGQPEAATLSCQKSELSFEFDGRCFNGHKKVF